MLTNIQISEHTWNTKAFLCTWCRTLVHTEEAIHVMFVRKNMPKNHRNQRLCDWNHLSLIVIVPAKPNSRRDRALELTQLHFAAQTKTFEHEGQNASKIESALTDTCIRSSWAVMSILMKTLCLFLVLLTIFLSVFHLLFFLPALEVFRHQNRLVFAKWTDGQRVPISAVKTITTTL